MLEAGNRVRLALDLAHLRLIADEKGSQDAALLCNCGPDPRIPTPRITALCARWIGSERGTLCHPKLGRHLIHLTARFLQGKRFQTPVCTRSAIVTDRAHD
jgi:hypothetical protein